MHTFLWVILPPDTALAEIRAKLAEVMHPFNENENQVQKFDQRRNRYYQHNPNGQFDYYQIGGRWDGEITGNAKLIAISSEQEPQPNPYFDPIKAQDTLLNNTVPVRDLPENIFPYCVLTPDGVWHSKDDHSDDWNQYWLNILSGYSHHLAVGVDIHN